MFNLIIGSIIPVIDKSTVNFLLLISASIIVLLVFRKFIPLIVQIIGVKKVNTLLTASIEKVCELIDDDDIDTQIIEEIGQQAVSYLEIIVTEDNNSLYADDSLFDNAAELLGALIKESARQSDRYGVLTDSLLDLASNEKFLKMLSVVLKQLSLVKVKFGPLLLALSKLIESLKSKEGGE